MKIFYNLHLLFSLQKKLAQPAHCLAMLAIIAWPSSRLFAQAPAISYSSPAVLVAGSGASLSPANAGGAVGAFGYNTTPTLVSTGVTDPVCMAMDKFGDILIGESLGQVSILPSGGSNAIVLATGFGPVSGIAVDASSNIFLADGSHVWKIPAGGGTPVTLGSFNNPVALTIGPDGRIYVADRLGAGVDAMAADGTGQVIYLHENIPIARANGVAFDSGGDLFVTDSGDDYLAVIAPDQGGFPAINGLSTPTFITTDPSGDIFLTDKNGIYRYYPIVNAPEDAGGYVNIDPISTDGLMVDANFNLYYADGHNIYKISPNGGYFISPSLPAGLSMDPGTGVVSGAPSGTLPATNYTVQAFNASGSSSTTLNITINPALPAISYSSPHSYQPGTVISALAPSSSRVATWGYSSNTTAIGSGIIEPLDVAADAAGNVYVTDVVTNKIVKIPTGNGSPVTLAAFSSPFGIAVDAGGNVYVAAASAGAILELPAGGGTTNPIGSGFSAPSAVAVDGSGNVYVADTGNGALKEIPAGNGTLVTLQSGFASIQGVAVDAAGNIYVADAGVGTIGNGAVYKVPAGGGSMVSLGTGFSRPSGVVVDAAGNLYVSDINKSVITVIEAGGTQFTLGSGFNSPNGVAIDGSGNVYIADSNNGAVKEVKITGGYFLSPFLPSGLTFNNSTGIISGTPAAASITTNYTATAWNITGSGTATVNITVGAPVISYNSPAAYTTGAAITPLLPTSTGGPVAAPAFNASTLSTGLNDATCLAMDKAGNIYIGESSGKVSKLTAGSSTASVFATGFATSTGVHSEGIAVDASGNVYFADDVSVWKIPAGGGAATALGSFHFPNDVAIDASGNIYVADSNASGGIFKMAADGTGQTMIDNTLGNSVAVDLNGNVFFNDPIGGVYEIPTGGTRKTLNATIAVDAITTDAAGNVYVARVVGQLFYMLPASGGAPIALGPNYDSVFLTGLMTDANFNLYAAQGPSATGRIISKMSPVGGYFISPELPQGLTINPTSGAISGTPTAASPTTNYTVEAFNAEAGRTAIVNLTTGPPPAISYNTPQTYTTGIAVTPLLPSSTGAAVAAPGFNATAVTLNTGFDDATCLAMDKAGNIYIGESSGKVSVLAPGGTSATVFATGFSNNTGNEGITVDASGNVYFADGFSVWKIPAGGGTPVTLGSFRNAGGVAFDAAGNIYVYDSSQGGYKMAADGTGQIQLISGRTNGIAADPNGNVFFSLSIGGIDEIPAGGALKLFASTARGTDRIATDISGNVYAQVANNLEVLPANGGPAIQVQPGIGTISTVMIDRDFNLYEIKGGSIFKVNATGGYFISPELPVGLSIDPTSGAISGTPSVFSPATNYTVTAFSASISSTAPVNITVNAQLPVISYSTPQVYTTGAAITPLTPASTGGAVGTPGFNANLAAVSTGLTDASCLAMDKTGNIYIGELLGSKVSRLTPGSASATVFSTGGYTVIEGIAVDASGNVYVADQASLWKIPPGGGSCIRLGNFPGPQAVAIDAANNIYVGDAFLGIYKIAADGTGQTKIDNTIAYAMAADQNGDLFFNDDAGTLFEIPAGGTKKSLAGVASVIAITTDPSGNVYVTQNASPFNLYMFPASGGPPIRIGPADSFLSGLMVDPNFNLYACTGGNVVKMNATGGYFTSPELPAGLTINLTSGIISGTPSAVSPATDYAVTAFNATGSGTATINIKVKSSDATLNTFKISNGTLTPAFAAGTTTYADTIASFTSSVTALLTTTDPNATVTINSTPVTSGVRSSSFPMSVGNNTLSIVVTAQDGVTTKTYTINVNRSLPNNALLSSIKLSPAATLVSTTGPGYLNFNAAVANATSTVQVIPTVQDPNATITVNGTAVASGSPSSPITLNVGLNVITTVVIAQDGKTTKTTIITVDREGVSNDALLASVSTNPKVTLVSATGEGYLNFTAIVTNTTGSIEVIPAAKDPNATITVNGLPVASGSPSTPVRLDVGSNTIVIVITGPDGATHKFVTMTVTREAPSTNALIASIKTTPVETLIGTTGLGYLNFTAAAANSTSSIQVIPTAKDANATITVNGNPVISGEASSPIALNVGANVITTVITAQDGITTKTIIITVNRAGLSTNALLASISLSPISTLVGTTGTGYLNYKSTVANTETSVKVIPTAKDVTATIKVNGEPVTSGSESPPIALNVGANTITTVITAEDGITTKTIIITVNRAAPPSLNSLYQPIPISVTKPVDSVSIENDGITVHQAISPNGDGINDYLAIDGISNYPDNRLVIVDRNGATVYQTKGYDNASKLFDGHSNINGKMQLPGTYFYSLVYTVNGENKHKTGYIILKY